MLSKSYPPFTYPSIFHFHSLFLFLSFPFLSLPLCSFLIFNLSLSQSLVHPTPYPSSPCRPLPFPSLYSILLLLSIPFCESSLSFQYLILLISNDILGYTVTATDNLKVRLNGMHGERVRLALLQEKRYIGA